MEYRDSVRLVGNPTSNPLLCTIHPVMHGQQLRELKRERSGERWFIVVMRVWHAVGLPVASVSGHDEGCLHRAQQLAAA